MKSLLYSGPKPETADSPPPKDMILAEVPEGARVRLLKVLAGRSLAARLADMGLRIGTEVQVVNRRSGGAVALKREGQVLAIGGGMAQKIIVEPVTPPTTS